jgi:hypothetical protein
MEEIASKPKFEEVPDTISPKDAIKVAREEFGIRVGHKKMVQWCEKHKCAKQPGGVGGKIYIDPIGLRRFLSDGKDIDHGRGRKKATVTTTGSAAVPQTRRRRT